MLALQLRIFLYKVFSFMLQVKPKHVATFFKICLYNKLMGARGGAVDSGTALQTGRSGVRFPMVSLEFFIGIILPAAL